MNDLQVLISWLLRKNLAMRKFFGPKIQRAWFMELIKLYMTKYCFGALGPPSFIQVKQYMYKDLSAHFVFVMWYPLEDDEEATKSSWRKKEPLLDSGKCTEDSACWICPTLPCTCHMQQCTEHLLLPIRSRSRYTVAC